MVRVAIIAPNLTVRLGLRALVGSDEHLEIVQEAASLAAHFDPPSAEADVVIVARASLSARDAGDLAGAGPSVPAILLIGDDAEVARGLVGAPLRAWGLLPAAVEADALLAAVHALAEGLVVLPSSTMAGLIRPAAAQALDLAPLAETLTAREAEVLQWMAVGCANKEIAAALGISEHTVKFHVSAVLAKLAVSSRTEAVRVGIQRGLVVL